MSLFAPWLLLLGFVGTPFPARSSAGLSAEAQGPVFNGTWVGSFGEEHSKPNFVALRMDQGETSLDIGVSIRGERIAGVRATDVVARGDRLAFDVRSGTNGSRRGPIWHFDLKVANGRLEGDVRWGADRGNGFDSRSAPLPLSLQRALDLKLDQFLSYVGDYRLVANGSSVRLGTAREGDTFFVGYGTNNAGNRSGSHYAYVTLGDRFRQIVPTAGDTFLADDGGKMIFERNPAGRVTRLRWIDAAAPGAAQGAEHLAARVELWREENISFNGPAATLAGTVYTPTSKGPHPALVFVHGSGPQTRLDNWPMADRFARAGIACLSFDKRGTGDSTGDWQQADFEVLADDVVAAVETLRQRPDIRPDAVGLWGVSQAGWVIPIAANKSDHVAFCIPVSGGAVSPAEQELWRRGQFLQFFGGDSRLLEAMRRGVALHFQWEQLFKAGRFPIPPFFETEPLNMNLDAPANIRQVRQPVLAIFGETDVLTPPRESAAVWANELESGGNSDYSVRLFPHATHGLLVSDRPFEVLPESRLAPGYLKTMIEWIARHTGESLDVPGTPEKSTAEKAAPDSTVAQDSIEVVAGTSDVVEARGMQKLSWFGSAPVQVMTLIAGTLGTLWTLFLWPTAWGIRRFRRMPRRGPPNRKTIILGCVVNSSGLAMAGALLAMLRFLGDTSPSAYYGWTEFNLCVIAALTVPMAWYSVQLVRSSIRAMGKWGRSRWESSSAWIAAGTACLWTAFFVYWAWGPLLS